MMQESVEVYCPYCGEPFEALIDPSVRDQEYTEDCAICCQPIIFHVTLNDEGEIASIKLRREDE